VENDAVLVTGGAGFIGSHLVDRLVGEGRVVVVLDSLEPQVHRGSSGFRNAGARYIEGSIHDRDALGLALDGVGAVVHLAAQVGVGQSMYEMSRYVGDNTLGTVSLLEELAKRTKQVRTLVVASSMSIYGEGQYRCDACDNDDAEVIRHLESLRARDWEPVCRHCSGAVRPIATRESKRLSCESVYAITKRDQEELALVFGRAYGIRAVALRFFNVFGPRQSLSNPYTGVAAIFSSRLLNGQAPEVFEDGLQTRDFIHVSDIAQAIQLALSDDAVGDVALNVGTGVPTSVLTVAQVLGEELGVDIEPKVVNRFRQGDVRHCFADATRAREVLGFQAAVGFREGMHELVGWIREGTPEAVDLTERATDELAERGLVL
jgi:dTDP-L-rhamnose 4-epimerase